MKTRFTQSLVVLGTLCSGPAISPAFAWDPVGDLTNPGRILRNVEREGRRAIEDIPNVPGNVQRELENAGRAVDDARLEAMVQAGAPAFQAWLEGSRNTSIAGAQPIPPQIASMMRGFYDDDLLQRVRFRIGDAGVFNLASLSIRYGDEVAAVTLIDVIVFREANGVNDPVLWAHELQHVRQFRDWGTRDFAIRYLRHWNAVEGEAYARQNEFAGLMAQGRVPFAGNNVPGSPPPGFPPPGFPPPGFPPPTPFPVMMGGMCVTPVGPCPMMAPLPVGQPCQCQGPQGIFQGQVR